jgi:hypothetical protein
MNTNVLSFITILAVVLCSFGYLLDIMLADWKASEKTKGALFSGIKNGFRERKPGLSCFQVCMKKFAWDVDEVPLCASKCQA